MKPMLCVVKFESGCSHLIELYSMGGSPVFWGKHATLWEWKKRGEIVGWTHVSGNGKTWKFRA